VGAFGNSYFELTLAPVAGSAIDFSTARLDYTIGTNPTFTTKLVTSVDGFTTPLATHVNGPGGTTLSDSLASLGVQNDPVTIRMYGQVDSNSGQSGFFGSDATIFSVHNPVTAATPEPSALCLMLVGGGLLYCAYCLSSLPKFLPGRRLI
jgi:hypothetical protein